VRLILLQLDPQPFAISAGAVSPAGAAQMQVLRRCRCCADAGAAQMQVQRRCRCSADAGAASPASKRCQLQLVQTCSSTANRAQQLLMRGLIAASWLPQVSAACQSCIKMLPALLLH